jgi:hypothetical protein
MKVVVFTASANAPQFERDLLKFAEGVSLSGDYVCVNSGTEYEDCDVAVFFGSWKNMKARHHEIKNKIVSNAKNFIVMETPLIGRQKVEEAMRDTWYRIGLNGFLADTGEFNNADCDSLRWDKVKSWFNIDLKSWNYKPNGPIILPLQLPTDASLRGASIEKWAYESIVEIRRYTDRPIVVRTPQLDRAFNSPYMEKIRKPMKNVVFQKGTYENLIPTLEAASCTVCYSSGFAIDSLLHGCPTIACSPSSFAYELCQNNPQDVVDLQRPDREQLFYNLSYAQWEAAEIQRGLPWKHLRKRLLAS